MLSVMRTDMSTMCEAGKLAFGVGAAGGQGGVGRPLNDWLFNCLQEAATVC